MRKKSMLFRVPIPPTGKQVGMGFWNRVPVIPLTVMPIKVTKGGRQYEMLIHPRKVMQFHREGMTYWDITGELMEINPRVRELVNSEPVFIHYTHHPAPSATISVRYTPGAVC